MMSTINEKKHYYISGCSICTHANIVFKRAYIPAVFRNIRVCVIDNSILFSAQFCAFDLSFSNLIKKSFSSISRFNHWNQFHIHYNTNG